MTYSEQIRHPGGALDPPRKRKWWEFVVTHWFWFVAAGILVLFLIRKFRPQWLARVGVHVPGSAGVASDLNPMGWV